METVLGPFAYFAPAIVGFLLPFSVQGMVFAHPMVAGLPDWAQWAALVLLAVTTGITFQLIMIGLQGFFAQILPVPVGRSIRGRWASAIGVLLIAAVVLGWVAGVLYSEGFGLPGLIAGIGCLVALAAAGLAYIWNLPAAVRDFAGR